MGLFSGSFLVLFVGRGRERGREDEVGNETKRKKERESERDRTGQETGKEGSVGERKSFLCIACGCTNAQQRALKPRVTRRTEGFKLTEEDAGEQNCPLEEKEASP